MHRWVDLFEEARAELISRLGSSILSVHHVGSTSVPRLCAKPILDLLVLVQDFDEAVQLAPKLESLGYEFRPDEDVPDRHFFRRPPGGEVRTHHLSLSERGSKNERMTISFRDALRRDPDLAASYGHLKLELARRFPLDRPAYIERKSEFVSKVLAREGLD